MITRAKAVLFYKSIPSLLYIAKIAKHKAFVLIAMRKVLKAIKGVISEYSTYEIIRRCIFHDKSKFTPTEFGPYKDKLILGKDNPEEFKKAVDNHYLANDHHIEHWRNKKANDEEKIYIVNEIIIEMIIDWMASCRTNNGYWPDMNNWVWGKDNVPTILSELSPKSNFMMKKILINLNLYVEPK